jgi:hypothetical protein
VVNVVLAMVCAAIGLVALPFTFGTAAMPWATPVWLAAAVLIAACLLALLPRLSRPLATAITSQTSSVTPSQNRLVAQLIVLGVLLVVVQAILRRPLALLVSGGERTSASFEAAIAATALTLVLALLVWLYQTARPVVQSVTLRAIDAAIPTVEAAPLSEPARTVSVIGSPLEAEPTVRAPSTEAEPTVRVPSTEAEPTVRVPSTADEATLRAPALIDGPTLITRARPPDADATIARDPDATLRTDEPPA